MRRGTSRWSIRPVMVWLLMVWHYVLWEFVTVTVEDSDVAVGLEWVGCDFHDSSVEVVQVMD